MFISISILKMSRQTFSQIRIISSMFILKKTLILGIWTGEMKDRLLDLLDLGTSFNQEKQYEELNFIFRVEGLIKDGETNKDFKSLKTQKEISDLLKSFITNAKIKVILLHNNLYVI